MLERRAEREGPVRSGRLAATSGEPGGGPERQLDEAVRRAARAPRGRLALVLHLSRMPPPGVRPHHRRVARAIVEDTAQRHDGQVFALGNGDLVLVCRAAAPARAAVSGAPEPLAPADPADLPGIMARLLRADMPDPDRIASLWRLEESLAALTDYAAARLGESAATTAAVPPVPLPSAPARVVEAIAAMAETGDVTALLQRQTGVLVAVPSRVSAADAMPLQLLYSEIGFPVGALAARAGAAGLADADPWLFRHLAGRLDRRMLALLGTAAGRGGALDVAAVRHGAPPLHVNLTLPGLLSEGFAALALLCRRVGVTIGAEVALVEACADPAGFAQARRLLAESGLTLVLDGVSHLALTLARCEAFRPDLLKLDWSPALPDLSGEERMHISAALERIGPRRVVLQRAETEAALRWGLANGIRRFQGRHVDAMLTAGRMQVCPRSAGCSLRQCVERAAATGPAGRAGCPSPDLLDGAAPARVVAA